MRASTIAALVLLLLGCTARYQVANLSGQGSVRLDPSVSVYIAVPEDGSYGAKSSAGSGQVVAQSVAAAFATKGAKIQIADRHQSRDGDLSAARQFSAGYVVLPTIYQWEQRAMVWSGLPSRMRIRIVILDARTGDQLTATSIEGRSQIVSSTSTSPESLLKDPLAEYVDTLY